MSGILTGIAGVLVTALCAVLVGRRGSSWCRLYIRAVEDPPPRYTWLLSPPWQTGLALVVSALVIGWAAACDAPMDGLLAAPIAAILCQAGAVDAVCHRLPDALLLIAALLAILSGAVRLATSPHAPTALSWLGATALAYAITYLLSRIRSGMGYGDVKLMGVVGLWLGGYSFLAPLWALTAGAFIGGLAALVFIVFRRARLKDSVALGPYLIAGVLLVWALAIS